MSRHLRRACCAAMLPLCLLSACGGTSPQIPVQTPPMVLSTHLADSSTGFGLALVDRLLAQKGAGNVFISPLSATIALSMAASAASGQTRASMLTALGLDPALDPSGELRQLIGRLDQSDADVQLELAQAVWAQNGLRLNPAYVAKLRDDYQAMLANIDFQSPDAPATVNRWVDAATHHTIPSLVDRFDPNVVAFLVNATYFHALWASEFKALPQPISFHTFSGAVVTPPSMELADSVTELVTSDFSAVLLPYQGGRFSAVLVLPRATLAPADFSTLLTQATWSQTLTDLHKAVGESLAGKCTQWSSGDEAVSCDVTLRMPKFTVDDQVDLTSTLRELGMPVPGASVPAICSACYISDVLQKTHLEVDEKGTTASAATGVAVELAFRMPTVVDRPFALALLDNETDAPLFLGAIGNLG